MNAETAARWLTAAPCATSIKASTAPRDGGKKARTARAASERALLTSLHGVGTFEFQCSEVPKGRWLSVTY